MTARGPRKLVRFFDLLSILGFALALPALLLVFGKNEAALAPQRALGAFGSPGALLLGFLAAELLAAIFGSCAHALPVLAGLAGAFILFGGALDLPFLGLLRSSLGRLPAFSKPGPALSAGVFSVLTGNFLGAMRRGRSGPKSLIVLAAASAAFLVLGVTDPFPALKPVTLSVDGALRAIAAELGKEYRSPEVENAVRKVVNDLSASTAEKDQRIAELAERLRRSEEDAAALRKAAEDGQILAKELEASRKTLDDLKGRLDREEPLLVGRDYPRAVQPNDPAVRDYAVRLAAMSPGAYDNPQGSKVPTQAGLGQVYRVHGALASSWKYVSDPAVSWNDYASPARRTLALGLAGDCDDFAIIVASCVAAIGGRARIMHGFDSGQGHAWAEAWLGSGESGRVSLARLAAIASRPGSTLAHSSDGKDGIWVVLDWRFGELSIRPSRVEVAWMGD